MCPETNLERNAPSRSFNGTCTLRFARISDTRNQRASLFLMEATTRAFSEYARFLCGVDQGCLRRWLPCNVLGRGQSALTLTEAVLGRELATVPRTTAFTYSLGRRSTDGRPADRPTGRLGDRRREYLSVTPHNTTPNGRAARRSLEASDATLAADVSCLEGVGALSARGEAVASSTSSSPAVERRAVAIQSRRTHTNTAAPLRRRPG